MVGLDSVTFVTASSTNLADEISREATSRVALVTGGGKGIGRAIADRLAGAGHRVAVTYRSGEVSRGVLGVRCDVTDPEQVESAFGEVEAALGPVDILVANAGITRDTLLMRMSDADWDAVIATNLTGAFRPHHLHLVGGGVTRIGRAGQLRRVEVGPGGHGPLAGS
jgi:3-oxoacyl-[acyl-carrier protein] reductase